MALATRLDAIVNVIQLSVAPVFLLTGIGAILGVMAQRLARVIDRARQIEPLVNDQNTADDAALHEEYRALGRRARAINRAITLCVLSALLVCAVIVGLFVSSYYAWSPDLTRWVAGIFGAALLALITGLLFFLREVYDATKTLRIGK